MAKLAFELCETINLMTRLQKYPYDILEYWQKQLLRYITCFSIHDGNDRIIEYLTNSLNLISDILFK